MKSSQKKRLLLVVMDGVGINRSPFGNAYFWAHKPSLDRLSKESLYCELFAHGTHVGMPSDADLGNSEVGHNAIGAGRVFEQGAKLVQTAIASGDLFDGVQWQSIVQSCQKKSTLHFLGLLSDGNVHSHEDHLYAMIRRAATDGVKRIRVHVLTDGRDVSEGSAEVYLRRLEETLLEVTTRMGCDARIADVGGRMHITMDRYEADWAMVERGWKLYVDGVADYSFKNALHGLAILREKGFRSDQSLPSFIVVDETSRPVGLMEDGDNVIYFNFRGDRAIEMSLALESTRSVPFQRDQSKRFVFYGMMQYDGDLKIPENFLVTPPVIDNTFGEHLADLGLKQFACSETQKYGHVTYFWNGNRSGKFSEALEDYVEITSDLGNFDENPEMKAREITQIVKSKILEKDSFDFARVNFANGDMVGHTGNFFAAVKAVEAVDRAVGELMELCKQESVDLIVTADHGNCDEMIEIEKNTLSEIDQKTWTPELIRSVPYRGKTSHTTNKVPCFIRIYSGRRFEIDQGIKSGSLANLANTCLELLDIPQRSIYLPSLIRRE